MARFITLLTAFAFVTLFLLSLSNTSYAGPRTDFIGPGNSGAFYDFYLDYMYPKGKRPQQANTTAPSAKHSPRTDFIGPGNSGAFYDFYLDYMYPKGERPHGSNVTPLTAKHFPRTDFIGPGNSGAFYDFYLDYMYPKGKSHES